MEVEAPALVDDAVEEVLLRFPPDDPTSLLRAALVCKSWSRVVSNPGFRHRYAERHRAAPALGFLCNNLGVRAESAHFVPTSISFRPPRAVRHKMCVLDARHGRVLLLHGPPSTVSSTTMRLVVWDPVADEQWELPAPPVPVRPLCWNAAVICAADGCDHIDCNRRSAFRVVVVGVQTHMYSCVYSSKPSGMWSTHTSSSSLDPGCYFKLKPSALVKNALHFILWSRLCTNRILKYHLVTMEMSEIELPYTWHGYRRICLMTTEEDSLGFVDVGLHKLYIWSRVDDGPGKDARWCQSRVIDVKTLLPAKTKLYGGLRGAVGFGGSVGVILLMTPFDNFLIDLKSNQARKLGNARSFNDVFPFTSFCFPALGAASTGERQQVGAQNASQN